MSSRNWVSPLGRWLDERLASAIQVDEGLAWSTFDRVVEGILNGGQNAMKSGLVEVQQSNGPIQQALRALDHAMNAPLGNCASALLKAVPKAANEAKASIPDHIKIRLERLCAEPGEGSDHAVAVTMRHLLWLMHVEPDWTKELLLPMLDFDHPAAEPAWNGFLSQGQPPASALAILVKPLLLEIHPWIERMGLDHELGPVDKLVDVRANRCYLYLKARRNGGAGKVSR